MVQLESAARLAALRDKADAVTGESSATLAGAVDALIAGFGAGGGGYPIEDGTYEYVHSEDWGNSTLGLASNFVNLYCSNRATNQIVQYECEITGNPVLDKYGVSLYCVCWDSYKIIVGTSDRYTGDGGINTHVDVSNGRAFYIAMGATIKVKKTILWESE